jgi:hypothetical protein
LRYASGFGSGFECDSHFFGTLQCSTDVSIFRTGIERNYSIAVLAVRLGSVADILRPLSKYLRAFRAFDFHFFVDHEIAP